MPGSSARNRCTSASRRARNRSVMASTSSCTASLPNASAAAHMAMVLAPDVVWGCNAFMVRARSRGPSTVVNAAVDLVGDHPHALAARPLGDGLELGQRVHGAAGIGGRVDDQPLHRLVVMAVEGLHRRPEAPLP